ncbi:substrate-binding domain-containing protein [Novosphingobium sp. CF614]
MPTAIFATNDDMVAGVFAASAQLGIHIPSQLSVTGFDDSWIAENV